MKNTVLLTVLLAINFCSTAQNSLLSKDKITLNGFKIFVLNIESLIENFGQPLSEEDFFFEMSNKQGKKIFYENLLVYVMNDKIKSFEISGSQYLLTEYGIKIGDNLNILKELFPKSYDNKKESSLSITLKEYDKYITFFFDEDHKVSMIRMGDY